MSREPGDDDFLSDDPDDEPLVALGDVLDTLDSVRAEASREMAMSQLRGVARTPPHDMAAERAVLGACLLQGSVVDDVLDAGLSPEHFYRPHHGTVFAAILSLRQRTEPVDVVTVVNELQQRQQLDAVGGAVALSQLEALLPTAAHAVPYARIVRDKAQLRRVIETATEAVRSAYAQDRPAADLIEATATSFMDLTSTKQGTVVDRAATVRKVIDAIGKKGATGLPTGFRDLDNGMLRRGLRPSQMIVVGARPAMGKTAFSHHLASNITDMGVHGAFFSLEMDGDELIEREIAGKARIAASSWERAVLTTRGNTALAAAAGFVSERPLHLVHCPGASLARIAAELRRLVAREGVGFAVVDHLGLVAPANARENRTQQVGANSRGLKALAGELRIPIVVLSQLNRGVESRDSKRPGLGDLRDTGDIEQDADVVMFLHRPEYYTKEKTEAHLQGVAEVIIEKQRNGPTGVMQLFFDAETTRFRNAVEGQ